MDTESVLVVDDTDLSGHSHAIFAGAAHNQVVVVGAAGAIAKAHGLDLGRLVSGVTAAQEAFEAKGRLDAREDLAATSLPEAVQ